MDVPVLTVNRDTLRHIVKFIYTHESTLTQFGALKILLTSDCQLALKKKKTLYTQIRQQEVKKCHGDELVYTIERSKHCQTELNLTFSSIMCEESFWSALSHANSDHYHSDVTVFPNKSFFYDKLNRKYFAMCHVPLQSLLRLLTPRNRKIFRPKAALAHGPGAIFPLATTAFNLSTRVYQHTGGTRQWYVIPASEREALRKLIQCDSVLIDPSVLDKYQIRYHRLVQHSNELVVLAPGAITQSFVTNTCWSESCLFALPTWIRDGHAITDWKWLASSLDTTSYEGAIDLSVFTDESIEEYIREHLSHTILTKISPRSIESASMISSLLTPDSEVSSTREQEDHQLQFPSIAPLNMPMIIDESRYVSGHQNEQPLWHNQNTTDYNSTNLIEDEFHSLYEFLSEASVGMKDTTDLHLLFDLERNILDESQPQSTMMSQEVHHQSKRSRKNDVDRTLYISGLRNNVTKADLYKYFPGSIKVTLKSSHSGRPFQYAFILHRTVERARQNLRIPIDRSRFGSECSIAFAHDKQSLSLPPATTCRFWNDKTIVVTKIPPAVTLNELQNVFVNGHIIKYCSAYWTNRSEKSKLNPRKREKLLTGYAFISFDTHEELTSVIGHAPNYCLHGQSLTVTLHRQSQSTLSMNE